ncbi:hypothetical protein HID58_022136 [Brassica napus]|uniref:J domain-containing protein n=1 Tax=Brassica napus TaxID=3708 RepID=A0ABQ8CZY0_BRANA|nr:auxilin-related protein 2-like isoform X1 [Brassica napus]KAH0922118.1 hypothetical protein HID58_022136 [Brassica napus]
MDEFGVLTERYGIKPQGKSAPMAASKRSHNTSDWKSYASSSSSNKVSGNGDDIFFTSSSTTTTMNGASSGDFDVFGGMNNKNSKSSSSAHADDLFGAMPTAPNNDDDIFGSFSSSTNQYPPVDDLLAGFGALKSQTFNLNNSSASDELIPGFGFGTSHSKTTASNFVDTDPFVVLESSMSGAHSSSGIFVDPLDAFAASVSSQGQKPSNNTTHSSTKLKPPPKPTQKVNRAKSSVMSSVDELDDFAMGGTMRRSASASDAASKYREAQETKQFGVDDLDSFFSSGPRSSSVPKSRTATEALRKPAVNVPKKTTNGVSSAKKPPAPAANLVDDFSALFGEDPPIFKEFEEIPGETEERRKARWDREQRTKSRVAQAVADMNNRDHQSRIEQEQRTRISETADAEIKRWATGKEGNMRALLSSLQIVLWPGCGWEAVSLTDLITSSAVKKVYRKATLYVHPDKVQQKGATLEQKYIAEKVFDILKEAWNKFNKEELS